MRLQLGQIFLGLISQNCGILDHDVVTHICHSGNLASLCWPCNQNVLFFSRMAVLFNGDEKVCCQLDTNWRCSVFNNAV